MTKCYHNSHMVQRQMIWFW